MPGDSTSRGPMPSWACSRMRETSSIEGLPIAASIGSLKCGVAAVELATGRIVGLLEFVSGIDELFDVRVDPSSRFPFFSGTRRSRPRRYAADLADSHPTIRPDVFPNRLISRLQRTAKIGRLEL